jgi:hypothetical protein
MKDVPRPLVRVSDLLAAFPAEWFLCGGWAVDAWLGRQTREHPDVDIALFQEDQRAIFDLLAGWQLIAHDISVESDSTEAWDGHELQLPAHIHARSYDDFNIEILLNKRSDRDWILSEVPLITMPLHRCADRCSWNLPALVAEILLFYKAEDIRPHDEADFRALRPQLSSGRIRWLAEAISRLHPGHPWLTHLHGNQRE